MSRSLSRLSAHVSFSAARATAPVIARASRRPLFWLPGQEAGIRTLSHVFHGAGMASPNNRAIHGYAARYLSTFPCSSAAAKAGWSTTGLPSSIINQKKSAFVDSLGGVKRTCSTGTSKKHEHF